MFADEWSQYLIEQLPKNKPITSFTELDEWVDSIWESFYNEHEEKAKQGDGILLNKFYNEGSCATIAAAWKIQEKVAKCMAYGDSVVFHYSFQTGILEHSFTKLADFCNPPRLVSCKDPLEEEGFKHGEFVLDDSSVVFAASDADFIRERADHAAEVYEQARRDALFADAAQELAMSALLKGLRFSKYSILYDVVDSEFPLEVAVEDQEAFVKNLLPLVDNVYSIYDLTDDDFAQSPDYDQLYTELTGAVALFIESNGVQ